MSDNLGDRMQRYEKAGATHLMRRTPVIVRVDGRAFHTFTRGLEPFSRVMIDAMCAAASACLGEFQGCVLAYVQSDEASFLLTDWATLETEPWFAYDLQKVVSLAAAEMTWQFRVAIERVALDDLGRMKLSAIRANQGTCNLAAMHRRATFDARAFNLPMHEVANYFLWRARDWRRNSIQMLGQAHYSPKELHGVGVSDLLVKLEADGHPWEALGEQEKFGTFISRGVRWENVVPTYEAVTAVLSTVMPEVP